MARVKRGEDIATTRQPSSRAHAGVGYEVTVVDGPEAGRSLSLEPCAPRRVLIGTSPACELRLADTMVSRRHAALEFDGLRLSVTDLDSTNGTFVNEVSVTGAFLRGGETLRFGTTTARVELRAFDAAASDQGPNQPASAGGFARMVGASARMRLVFALAERLAASEVPFVVEGETGTGKEIISECIHERGRRAAGPFVVFDCAATPRSATQEVLFGDRTGRPGMFELAHGGTLVFDEIGSLDLDAQAALLRAIERGEIRRVGDAQLVQVDVRATATTSRDLDKLVETGAFREDLFFRLAVGRIDLPPLRRRLDDVPLLVSHFFRLQTGSPDTPPEFFERFQDYHWPGNVRELANAVARFVALGPDESLSARVRQPGAHGTLAASAEPGNPIARVLEENLAYPQAKQRVLDAFDRAYVARVLAAHNGNVARAAAASGIARRYFQMIRARQR
jgi:DNA-binding NtrC family response regulator